MSVSCDVLPKVPKISVLMALNRADAFLPPAIESVLNQSFDDFEFLIIVDTSCAGLKEKVLELGRGDKRIRILNANIGGGVGFSRNLGVMESRGEYLAIMDGDDVSRPERFAAQVEYLDQHPEAGVVGCRVQMIDQNSRNIPRAYRYFQTNEEIRRVLPYRDPLPNPGLMIRKRNVIEVQGYRQCPCGGDDYEMFIRMARNPRVKFHNLDRVLLDYRRHPSQLTDPRQMKRQFSIISGYLFTELLETHSPKYILGMLILHPLVRTLRLKFRKLTTGNAL
jgi:O86/O127-antigen biosynthesis beta-1,3-galactosyltransferase